MARLEWDKLLSTQRLREPNHPKDGDNNTVVIRTPIEEDYDRIVGSSSVRRLQDKAQVFPLQEDDVARTRLTHSIEVSGLARSLGKAVGYQIEKRHDEKAFTSKQTDELAALLQVTGLVHDLGNPPFGHYGETAIRDWFENWFDSSPFLNTKDVVFTSQQKDDFVFFDGNAQNWRIITKLQTLYDIYGANFTYATLGTIIKYPWQSDKRPNGKEKFGYFSPERDNAIKVRTELGLNDNVRHPATFLLEAADDIIYLCDDIEDGVKKGLIDWPTEYQIIKKNLLGDEKGKCKQKEDIEELFYRIENTKPDFRLPQSEQETAGVRYFRNAVQSYLFRKTVVLFMENYDRIMSNESSPELLGLELLKCDPGVKALCNELKRVAKEHCFSCPEVLSLESAGHQVITSLLNFYVPALLNNDGSKLADTRYYPGKLFHRISPNFVYVVMCGHIPDIPDSKEEKEDENKKFRLITPEHIDMLTPYDRLRLVVDFIAGMTDSYAFMLYQELMGIKRP